MDMRPYILRVGRSGYGVGGGAYVFWIMADVVPTIRWYSHGYVIGSRGLASRISRLRQETTAPPDHLLSRDTPGLITERWPAHKLKWDIQQYVYAHAIPGRRVVRRPWKISEMLFLKYLRRPDVHFMCNAEWVTAAYIASGAHDAVTIYPPCNIPPEPVQADSGRGGIISVGRLDPDKGHGFCGEVAARCGLSCRVVGFAKPDQVPSYDHCDVMPNAPYDRLLAETRRAKCIISGCNTEDFGIAVVEAVANGCIPCVPDRYGFRETIPFDELRYEPGDVSGAARIAGAILEGTYDDLVPALYRHVRQFSVQRFKDEMASYLSRERGR